MKTLFASLAAPLALVALAHPSIAAAPEFQTTAPVAFMKDLSSGAILFQRDADRRMPPASMAKMMTVYVAFDLIKKGQLKLDDMVTVQPETWAKWHGPQAGSTMFLSPNEQVSVANLLYGIVTLSGNDACVVLAEHIAGTEQNFVERMNRTAKQIGLANSHFGTSNGWPDGGVTYVTARDLADLAEHTIQDFPKLYKQFYSRRDFTWGKTMGGNAITQANRDPLLGRVAGADGLKTGHTEEAGYGFTGSAEQNGRRLVMVMAGLTSSNARAEESVKFMNWGFRAWQAKPVVAQGKKVADAEVQMGSSSSVGLVAPRQLTVTLPAGLDPQMSAKVVYQGPIKAPIKAGQHIADLVINSPDMPAQRLPLVADKDVSEAGFFGRAWSGLTSLFG
ncbi:D-alanyl-D-alanine carboxypeptidase family protein [Sphingomonas sp. S17]|jgi:D-alanyl-D-alanine carboxypeptidase (penicillin-binding protein 5/6)|uniref:serine-type D-Ala-D-Ala carboxypeptidase n=2 Tax=Sphingomonas paucimobilis TaxID=13689 RepID=A0A411LG80_SPHPI|nr:MULTISPECIES: D-alanyl-D-alanine carboxypeptidase family protein [Sphingomonas]EGI56001.1 D-alanyl-D-alanine carboxypeptidase family protein [Sphingomonas sp. S17]MBQ1481254.1 D-alanyl-D-alanine carboxypeptidase [Sphingomonas sp.]MCM3679388.1 D-alanyl-D-alanine carboxypeptidase [Sphingomonas paucimobilis]MDG5972141.1 D-alanyl-D-alanine carboxypeptidase [Sphingomonas paucimobilis]NNG57855.1 D-alanyl-D-alanine carboxypeptidase [Sphingomonas paucimobilis]